MQKESSLPNHDPPPDSQTAAIVNEHMPYMVATYVRPPPMMVKGEGCHLWDIENRKYLDFTAGIAVNGLGHCDPEMSKLVAQQVCPTNLSRIFKTISYLLLQRQRPSYTLQIFTITPGLALYAVS